MGEAEDVMRFGTCEYCGNEITDEDEEYYVDSEGHVFCCVECVMEHYEIEKIEV